MAITTTTTTNNKMNDKIIKNSKNVWKFINVLDNP